ncbi:MAG: hypothetical protein SVU32_00730 [Candidatus Nanohaloarchaea archaeon]|nr:hypothetical protein [Candidatus Nanohaloarchaea archaeon]
MTSAYNLPEDVEDMNEYRREYLPDCPTCGYRFPLCPAEVFDPETGEIEERELYCMDCGHRWTWKRSEDTVQPALARWSL